MKRIITVERDTGDMAPDMDALRQVRVETVFGESLKVFRGSC
jgi:hypothetical protein